MRIGLLGEGTYPVSRGGVSTWYEQLIGHLDEHEFSVVTLVGTAPRVHPEMPANVADVTFVPMWDPPKPMPLLGRGRALRRVAEISDAVWRAVLPTAPELDTDLPALREALQALTAFEGPSLASVFGHTMSARPLVAAWREHAAARPGLPRLTLAEAASAVHHADPILGTADRTWPDADVIHLTSNGTAALTALGRRWRDGTPLVLTEHGVYLRERYLAFRGVPLSWAARSAVLALVRGLCRLGYAEADRLTPVSDFNGRWALDLGAPAERLDTIHNGVDTGRYPALTDEPDEPTVTWVGRVDPLKDLETMINAFALVRRDVPTARLRLFGPTAPENADYRAGLDRQISELALGDRVTFEGPVPSSVVAFEAGHVVALSSISEGLPFSVIEAMMCARATVNTDVGGVSEIVGGTGAAGLLVPPRDPEALAAALTGLLSDPDRRRSIAAAARQRALAHFDLATCIERYREVYAAAAAGTLTALPTGDETVVATSAEAVPGSVCEPEATTAPLPESEATAPESEATTAPEPEATTAPESEPTTTPEATARPGVVTAPEGAAA